MHGLQKVSGGGRWTRLLTLVVVGALGALLQAGVAQAVALPSNTISQTAITSPSDPSYFYDPTGGAAGGFTVAGTTNSTDPATDQVDIDCYTSDYEYSVAQDVSLDANGNFSTFIPYSELETGEYGGPVTGPDNSVCSLRAVPAGTESDSPDLSDYTGPRVLLAYLTLAYTGDGTTASDYVLVAPQLGATDVYTGAGNCGLDGTFINDQSVVGQYDADGFNCADMEQPLWEKLLNPSSPDGGEIEVDGTPAFSPYEAAGNPTDGAFALTLSATQDPTDGDMTIYEADPLASYDSNSQTYESLGVQEDRTIQQADSGNVVLITDRFVSTDGNAHSLTLNVENETCFLEQACGLLENGYFYYGDGFDPSALSFGLSGSSSYCAEVTCYPDDANPSVGSTQTPTTVYVENPAAGTDGTYGAITSFTAPYDGNYTFAEAQTGCCNADPSLDPYQENALGIPYVLSVPAGGSATLSIAYITDTSQANVDADIADATALEQAGVPSPPSSSSVPTTTTPGSTTAPPVTSSTTTGSGSYTDVGPQVKTAWVGPTYHPIANTLGASRQGRHAERLAGTVAAGSAGVSYYFQYGTTTHYGHRTKTFALAPGESLHSVTLTATTLHSGKTYHYRIVATGTGGQAIGADRTFTAGQA